MLKLVRRIRRIRPVLPPSSAFTGFRFPREEVIVLAVRWYLPLWTGLIAMSKSCWPNGAARPCRHCPSDRWLVDETYVKVAGLWVYLYRAIDQFGQVIEVLVSQKRDLAATRRFSTPPVPSSTAHDPAR